MYCSNCGRKLEDGQDICKICSSVGTDRSDKKQKVWLMLPLGFIVMLFCAFLMTNAGNGEDNQVFMMNFPPMSGNWNGVASDGAYLELVLTDGIGTLVVERDYKPTVWDVEGKDGMLKLNDTSTQTEYRLEQFGDFIKLTHENGKELLHSDMVVLLADDLPLFERVVAECPIDGNGNQLGEWYVHDIIAGNYTGNSDTEYLAVILNLERRFGRMDYGENFVCLYDPNRVEPVVGLYHRLVGRHETQYRVLRGSRTDHLLMSGIYGVQGYIYHDVKLYSFEKGVPADKTPVESDYWDYRFPVINDEGLEIYPAMREPVSLGTWTWDPQAQEMQIESTEQWLIAEGGLAAEDELSAQERQNMMRLWEYFRTTPVFNFDLGKPNQEDLLFLGSTVHNEGKTVYDYSFELDSFHELMLSVFGKIPDEEFREYFLYNGEYVCPGLCPDYPPDHVGGYEFYKVGEEVFRMEHRVHFLSHWDDPVGVELAVVTLYRRSSDAKYGFYVLAQEYRDI